MRKTTRQIVVLIGSDFNSDVASTSEFQPTRWLPFLCLFQEMRYKRCSLVTQSLTQIGIHPLFLSRARDRCPLLAATMGYAKPRGILPRAPCPPCYSDRATPFSFLLEGFFFSSFLFGQRQCLRGDTQFDGNIDTGFPKRGKGMVPQGLQTFSLALSRSLSFSWQ